MDDNGNIIENNIESKNEIKNEINDKEEKNNSINKDNIDINKIWNNNSKYKINYTHIFEYLKKRDESKYFNENEYWCNILLIPPEIEISDKISVLDLLSRYYDKSKKKN